MTLDEMMKVIDDSKAELERLAAVARKYDRLVDTCEEIELYLDRRADVDDGKPNEAMRLLIELREVKNWK